MSKTSDGLSEEENVWVLRRRFAEAKTIGSQVLLAVRILAILFLGFVGVLSLVDPDENGFNLATSIVLGGGALAWCVHLVHDHILRLPVARWTVIMAVAAALLWVAAGTYLADDQPDAVLAAGHVAVAVLATGAIVCRRAIASVAERLGFGALLRRAADTASPVALWRRCVNDPLDRAAAESRIADPLANILRRYPLLQGWRLYLVVVAITEVGVIGNFLFVVLKPGWVLFDGWWVLVLVIPQIMIWPSAAAFPLALLQVTRLERMFAALRLRWSKAVRRGRWRTFDRFQDEAERDFGRYQGLAFRVLVYVAIAWATFIILSMIVWALDPPPHETGFSRSFVLRGLPLVLTLGVTGVVAGVFLYMTALISARAILTVKWLYIGWHGFRYSLKEDHRDKKGGFAPIGAYAVAMIIVPLIFSLWTSAVAYRDSRIQDTGILEQAGNLAHYYAFEAGLFILAVLVPLYLGHKILQRSRQDRLEQIDSAIANTPRSRDSKKRRDLRGRRRKVAKMSTWPISLGDLGLITGAVALVFGAVMNLTYAAAPLAGSPELGLSASVTMTVIAVIQILFGIRMRG